MQVVLASASPRRKELLSQLLPEFLIQAAEIEEILNPHLPSLSAQVEELSLRKARAVAEQLSISALVLGSDTVVVAAHEILGKPRDETDAARMLRQLSGQWHEVLTGVALLQTGPTPQSWTTHAISRVRMRTLSESEILDYIASGEPLDKAGAYAIQGQASTFVEEVQGTWDTIVGLPLQQVRTLLESAGYSAWKD